MKTRTVLSLQLSPNLTLQTMPAPGGGPILAMIANIMSGKFHLNRFCCEPVHTHIQLVLEWLGG